MHVGDALRAGLLVQRIDVLRAQKEAFAECVFQLRQGEMRIIGNNVGGALAPLRVELPHHFRIGVKGFRRGDLFHASPAPDSVGAAKGGQAAFGADSSSGQHEDAVLR